MDPELRWYLDVIVVLLVLVLGTLWLPLLFANPLAAGGVLLAIGAVVYVLSNPASPYSVKGYKENLYDFIGK